MEVEKTDIEGVFVITPTVYKDSRGYFYESFNEVEFQKKTGIAFYPVQDNQSCSNQWVLRGLHFQREPYAQAKLVRCVVGEVYDVAVDIRPESETFGKYVAVRLSDENHKQLFIPEGFAHGFLAMSDQAVLQYKCNDFYHPEAEDGIAWDDKDININWPIEHAMWPITKGVYLSKKDTNRQTLKEYIAKQ